ncbi:MAG: LTA synthase family protein [Roseburia sp.]
MRDKKNVGIKISAVLYPALLFYVTAFMTYNPFVRTRWRAQLVNVLLFELLAVLLFVLLGNAVTALRTEVAVAWLLALVNSYVLEFRGSPLVPWDFLSLGTAAGVAGNYSYLPNMRQVVCSVWLLGMFVGAGWLQWKLDRNKWKSRLGSALGCMAGIIAITLALWDDGVVSRLQLYPFLFTPTVMYERNGFAVTFLMDLQYLKVEKPDGYSVQRAEELLEQYQEDSLREGQNGIAESDSERYPNVIVIMDEAFSDLSVLGEFETNRDYMPFVHSLQQGADNTVTGMLSVSVKGGNTANTEFEFLTGNTMAFLPAGSIPYQQYVRQETPSLASTLADLGYETYALHPYNASGWNRDKVYPLLGFSEFLSKQDFTNASYVRGYVDDASCVEKIIQLYEAKDENTPGFYFCVTMQNHSSYTDGYVAEQGNISVSGSSSRALEEYLTLMEQSDAALQQLLTYFSEQKEPTVVVFFGDHQPADSVVTPIWNRQGVDSYNLTQEQNTLRYDVPYVIWANFEMESATDVDTSANYLTAQVCQYAGIPLTPYQKFLLELSGEIPLISTQHTEGLEEKRIEDYQVLQYYFLFDKERD